MTWRKIRAGPYVKGLRVLNVDPPIFAVPDFISVRRCMFTPG